MSTIPGFYTPAEAARILGVSHAQVTRYASKGLLPSTRVGQNLLLEQAKVHTFSRPPRGNPAFRQQKKSLPKSAE